MCVNKQQISIVLKRPLKVLCVVAFFLSTFAVVRSRDPFGFCSVLFSTIGLAFAPSSSHTLFKKHQKKSTLSWHSNCLIQLFEFSRQKNIFIFQEFKFMSSLCFVDFFKVIFKHCESLFSVSTYFALHWFALFRKLNYWNGKMARTGLVSSSFYRQQLLTLIYRQNRHDKFCQQFMSSIYNGCKVTASYINGFQH